MFTGDYTNFEDNMKNLNKIIKSIGSELINITKINANSYFKLNNSQQYTTVNTQQNSNQITFLDLKDFKIGDGVALKDLGAEADDGFKTWLVAKIIDINDNVATLNREVSVSMENVEIHHDNTYNLLDISGYYDKKDYVNFYCEGGIYNLFSQTIYIKENLIPLKYGNGPSLLNFSNKKSICIDFNFAEFKNKASVMYGVSRSTRLYSGLTLKNSNNVNIKNLIINHNLKETLACKKNSGEYWTYGITIHGGKNIILENIICKEIESDGFYFGHHRADEAKTFCGELSGLRMINCEATECGRQGLSIGGGNNIHLIECSFNHIGWNKDNFEILPYRSNPSSSINFELETGYNSYFDTSMHNIRVTKCKLVNSHYIMAGASISGKLVIFEDCKFSQIVPDQYTDTIGYLYIYTPKMAEKVLFKNCIFEQYIKKSETNWFIQAATNVPCEIIFDTCIIRGIAYIISNNNCNIIIKNSNIIAYQKTGNWEIPFDYNNRCTVENSVITLTSKWLNSISSTDITYKFNKIKNSEYIIEDCERDATFSLSIGNTIEDVKLLNKNHNSIKLDSNISTYTYFEDTYMNKDDFKTFEGYNNSIVANNTSFSYNNIFSLLNIKPIIKDIDKVSEIKPISITQLVVNNSIINCTCTLYAINDIVKRVTKNNYLEARSDYIEYDTGKIINNVGMFNVLSQNISGLKRDNDNNAVFINLGILDNIYLPSVNMVNYCCNAFDSSRSWIDGYYSPKDEEYITCVGNPSYLSLHIYYSTLGCSESSTDTEIRTAFTNWAATNNIIVYYNLKTPKITYFDPIKLSTTTSNKINVICENGESEINILEAKTTGAKIMILAKKIDILNRIFLAY